jgi:two-component system CheB/CheR fusion protein
MREEIYKNIYNTIEEGLFVIDARGRVVCVNPATETILGYKEAELLGQVGHDLFHAHAVNNFVPLARCPIFQAFCKGESFKGEEVFRTKSGALIVVEVSCVPLQQSGGEYMVLFRDVSQRKKLEEEMIAFTRIVKETQDIVVIKDLDLRVIATNMAFARVAGKESPEALIGKTDAEIFGISQDVEPVRSYMEDERTAQQLPRGASLDKEEKVLLFDGSTAVYKTRKFPVHNQEGKVIATANISVDITAQKAQEERLKALIAKEVQKSSESDIFYNKIFETANLGICLTDKNGRFVVVNPSYCSIYGYTEAELIGEHFTKVVPSQNHETMRALHDAFIAGEQKEIPQEWDAVGRDGRQIRILATAGRLDNIVGGPYKITTITDMTEAYQMRLLQKHQEAMLIQQSKLASMGEMLGAIAHQWRQPLNVINCTTLDMRIKKELGVLDDAYFGEAIDELSRMTQSMSKTIDDFMNFFRPSKQKTFFDLHQCLEYAIDILSVQLHSHGIEVHNEVEEGVLVYGAKGELEQVILNLLSNARDAFEDQPEEGQKQIRLHVTHEDKAVVLVVEDNAGGMEKEVLERIFDPYFTTKGDKQGTGIGLYMSTTIMERTFNGSIRAANWYNSANNRTGTRMFLRFPLKEQQ